MIVQSEKDLALPLARALDDFQTRKHNPLPADPQTIARIESLLKEKAEKEREAKSARDMTLAREAYEQSLENKCLEAGLTKAWAAFYLFDVFDLLNEGEVRTKSHFSTPYTTAPQFNLYDALKLSPLSDTPVIPNVNLGKISANWLKSKLKGKDIKVQYDEPLGTYVVITDPKTKRYIRVMVAHAPSAYKAQVYMCLFRLI